jgi:hypothetical protein
LGRAQQARVSGRATFLSLRVADAAGPRVGRLLPPHAGRIPFPRSPPIEIRLQISPSLSWNRLRAI